ncbi:hypothetical protein NHX12_003752 [Muraenolepis orangiensis]|uniref:Uncharacterized protein n=1 Tax=Muraenolepis orangiensis TaxID=630683 RepID=A0A9Q0IDK6_9TELE|nr:hypothetical protein NHX12_003752 [Muraenolepis orangiensis]
MDEPGNKNSGSFVRRPLFTVHNQQLSRLAKPPEPDLIRETLRRYRSNYTHVPRYTLEAQKKKRQMQRSKGKSCGYYMRIVFFFSSLIQSLIIVSLVLFLVYGKKQDSAASGRIDDLEQSFSRVSLENVALQLQRKNLTRSLNLTLTERLQVEQELVHLRNLTRTAYYFITNMIKFQQIQHNQTAAQTATQVDQLTKDRDDLNLEAIDLRKAKDKLEWEIDSYKLRCKQDFVASLSGISNVSRAFLEKIDTLFPQHIPFQLTCEKQRDNLEQIRSNCTSLSREVEDTLQRYLDSVGTQVSSTLAQISHLFAQNKRLNKDYHWCSLNRTGMIQEHRQHLQSAQLRCDGEKKKLLVEKKRLGENKELLDREILVKVTEINHLAEQLKQLNASCLTRVLGPAFWGEELEVPEALGALVADGRAERDQVRTSILVNNNFLQELERYAKPSGTE